jgi:hypothetical protein
MPPAEKIVMKKICTRGEVFVVSSNGIVQTQKFAIKTDIKNVELVYRIDQQMVVYGDGSLEISDMKNNTSFQISKNNVSAILYFDCPTDTYCFLVDNRKIEFYAKGKRMLLSDYPGSIINWEYPPTIENDKFIYYLVIPESGKFKTEKVVFDIGSEEINTLTVEYQMLKEYEFITSNAFTLIHSDKKITDYV